jgi:hypothetical protein
MEMEYHEGEYFAQPPPASQPGGGNQLESAFARLASVWVGLVLMLSNVLYVILPAKL